MVGNHFYLRHPASSLPSGQSGVPSQRRCAGRQRVCKAQRKPPAPAAEQCAQLRSSSAPAQSGIPSHSRRDSASLCSPFEHPIQINIIMNVTALYLVGILH